MEIDLETINHALFQCCFSRQVLALANIPSPPEGFQQGSIYSNLAYMLSLMNSKDCEAEVKKYIPWVIWWIWKDRNMQLFEGSQVLPQETVKKMKLDALSWLDAQEEEDAEEENVIRNQSFERKVWRPPMAGWLKCNVGFHWSKRSNTGGASWVLRDSNGIVLNHARSRFPNVENVEEVKIRALCLAAETLRSMRMANVVFACQDAQLVKALQRPKAWPSFRNQVMDFYKEAGRIDRWTICYEAPSANRGAKMIAISATNPCFWKSYIASSSPGWLKELFDSERSLMEEE